MLKLHFGIIPKLTLVFVLFAAALLVGVGVLAFENARSALQAATVSELFATTIEKQAALNAWVADREADLVNISHSAHLQDEVASLVAAGTPSASKTARDAVLEDLQNWVGAGGGFRELLLIEPAAGTVIAATDASEEGKFKEDRPYFVNGKKGAYVQNPYYDVALQGPTMTIAAPIRSSDGRLLAVLAGRLDMAEMNAIIVRRTGLHRTDDAFLVNTSNLFVTQPRLATDPSVLQRGIHSDAIEQCLARNSGTVAAADYRGVPALIVYRWLPERQLCLEVKIDQAEAFAPERSLGGALLITGIVVLLLASGLAFGLARTITHPVRQLTIGAIEIGKGNLDYQIKAQSSDEIGQLAASFDKMAGNLRATGLENVRLYQETQQRADELARRVNELNALNTMASIVNQSLDVDEILNRAMDETLRQVGVEAAAMFLLDAGAGELVLTTHRGVSAKMVSAARRIKLGEGMGGKVAQTGTPIVIGSGSEYSGTLKAFYEKEHLEAGASVPLIGSTGVIGVMSLATTAPQYFDTAGVELLLSLGRQIAIGVEKARLYAETRAWAAELEQRVEAQTAQIRASEAELRALFAAMTDVILVLDRDGRYLEIAPTNPNLLYKPPTDLIGKTVYEIFPATQADFFTTHIRRALEADQPVNVAYSLPIGDNEIWFAGTIAPLNQDAVIWVARDVTESKHAEETVRRSETNYRTLMEQASDGIFIADRDGNYIDVNSRACEMTGYPRAELLKLNLQDLLLPEDVAAVPVRMAELRAGAALLSERRMRRKDGTAFPVEISGKMLADGRLQGIVRDITERKRAEEKLQTFSADLERSNQELEQFAYVASHDLQEPLRMVSSYMQLIARRYQNKLDADADEFIGFAVDGASRMQRMINDLLAFSRVGARGNPLQPTNTETVLNNALANLKMTIEATHAVVTYDPLPTVLADEPQLAQVFQNLIANAIKFHGDAPPCMHVSARKTSEVWEFSVRDNGIGIDPQFFDRIFLIFQRLHTHAEHPGSGIGLAICKKIVERHGGRIWIESEAGNGTTFYFTIPTNSK